MSIKALNIVAPPQLVRQRAFENLRDAIISGQIKPGTRLIERELCEAMGISRASVREVIRQLESERLVDVQPRKGPIVSRLTLKQAREIYEVRCIFEMLLVDRFTRVATDPEIAALREIFDQVIEAAGEKSSPRLVTLMFSFNDHMGKVVDHEVVRDILTQLNARISALRATSMAKPGRIEASVGEISEIMAAIEARDPERATRAVQTYVNNARDAALERLAAET